MSPVVWIGVAALGGTGALARFLVDSLVATVADGSFPVGTLTINVTGAFLLGLISGMAFGGDAAALAGTATVGSYTTFSTWMLETHRLREEGQFRAAAANVVVSLGL